jgi:probable HAF family extracellular repeat protein
MRHAESRFVFAIALAVVVALATVGGLAAQNKTSLQQYSVHLLGTLGGCCSVAFGINNFGLAAGNANLPGDTSFHATAWFLGSTIDIGTLGGPNSFVALTPNDLGQIASSSDTTTPDPLGTDFCGFGTQLICHPFVWQLGHKTLLPTLGGNNALAQAINNRGAVVGQSENKTTDPSCDPQGQPERRAVLWRLVLRDIRELKPLAGDVDALGISINDAGQVAGASGNCEDLNTHAVLWNDGKPQDLGNLGSSSNNAGLDINSQGEVVGISSPTDSTFHAFLWRKGHMTDLGTLPGDTFSLAISINNSDQVVGNSCDGDFNCRAFIWQNGVMSDLNDLIRGEAPPFLFTGTYINDRGEIVGEAFDDATQTAPAFVAIPAFGHPNGQIGPHAAGIRGLSARRAPLPDSIRNMLRQNPAGSRLRMPKQSVTP